jgi:hypothetical protein
MRRISPTLLVVVLLVASCGKGEADIQGSVFIVTKGADNYKLGLVKVTAIPESEIKPFIENKKSLINTETAKLKTDLDSVKSQIETAQAKYNELKTAYDSLNGQKKDLENQQSSLSGEFNSYYLSTCYSDYATVDMIAECRKQVQIGKQLDALNKKLSGFESRVSKAQATMSESEKALNAEKAKLDGVLEKVKNYLTPEYLMDGLPEGNIKSVTDADGKFSMKLPRGKYVLVASAQRRVFSSTEDYHWLVWVDATGSEPKQITLSNQNMLGEDTEDGVFKFKELIPSLESPNSEEAPNNVKV